MPSTYKSPYATSFTTAIKKGTPCHQAVLNICNRTHTTPGTVYQSLWKAGLCQRQKFNGQWVYWPTCGGLTTSSQWKKSQLNMWQWFVDWAICSGWCKPHQLTNNAGTQQQFMNFCKKYFNNQFNGTGANPKASTSTWKSNGWWNGSVNGTWNFGTGSSKKTSSKRSTKRVAKGRKTTKRSSTTHAYKFPRAKSTSRRYRVAA